MAQPLCIRLIWMCGVVWGEYQPQPWCCSGIISPPQVNPNPKIWGQLGRCKGIRVHPYALETAYQWLTCICLLWMDVWSNLRWISVSNMTLDSIISTPQVNLTSQIWGQLGRCNGKRVHPYALVLGTPYSSPHSSPISTCHKTNDLLPITLNRESRPLPITQNRENCPRSTTWADQVRIPLATQ